MKAYPSITTKIDFSKRFYLFDKLDGSNIRAEWSPKKGFYKFGSRTQLLTPDQTTLYPAIEKINALVGSTGIELSSKLSKFGAESAVCFFEWVGPNSFAGSHVDNIADMRPVLIDVALYKKGMMSPERFIEHFSDFDIPAILHQGKISEDIFQSIRRSELPGITFEGVIGKESGCGKDGKHDMCKIKTNAWLDKLKTFCGGNQELYNRLK